METKECVKCKETKSIEQFYKAKNYADGLDYYCKYCRTGSAIKSHRGGNKKPCTIEFCDKSHYAKGMCRTHYTRWNRNGSLDSLHDIVEDNKIYLYGKNEVTYHREYMLMYRYKLTKDKYNEMIKEGCNVCGNYQERNIHVDHDHACCNGSYTCGNCVRGVVCNACNQSIGKYESGLIRPDHPMIENIKQYLEAYQKRSA